MPLFVCYAVFLIVFVGVAASASASAGAIRASVYTIIIGSYAITTFLTSTAERLLERNLSRTSKVNFDACLCS